MAATVTTPQQPIQIAGRSVGLVAFFTMAVVGGRNLLFEPRTSPFDVVLWTGLLLLGIYLSLLALASLTRRLPARPDGWLAPHVALPVNVLMGAIAFWALVVAVLAERWLVAGAAALFAAAQTHLAWMAMRHRA